MIGRLSEAVEAGYRAGLERSYTPQAAAPFRSLALRDAFRRGWRRGMRARQTRLELVPAQRPALEQVSMEGL